MESKLISENIFGKIIHHRKRTLVKQANSDNTLLLKRQMIIKKRGKRSAYILTSHHCSCPRRWEEGVPPGSFWGDLWFSSMQLWLPCSYIGVKSDLQLKWRCGIETQRSEQVMLVTRAPWCLFASVLIDGEKQIRFKKRGGGGRESAQRSCKNYLTLSETGALQRKHYLSIGFGGGGFGQKVGLHMEKVCNGRDSEGKHNDFLNSEAHAGKLSSLKIW